MFEFVTKMSKKKILIFLSVALLLTFLVACDGENGDNANNGYVVVGDSTGDVSVEDIDDLTDEIGAEVSGGEVIVEVSVGEIIQFGGHDWRVLEVRDGMALLLSELLLGDSLIITRAFHTSSRDSVTWASSDMRTYLNGEFYNSFSEADRARIVETSVTTNDNPWFINDPLHDENPEMKPHGGDATNDHIFLLSLEEVVQYFGDSGQLRSRQDYAYRISDQYNSDREGRDWASRVSCWWLRSPGIDSYSFVIINDASFSYSIPVSGAGYVSGVGDVGDIFVYGTGVSNHSIAGVRPALWLNLSSEE